MVVIINNRVSRGFLLIEIMTALTLLVIFTGVIAYYCSYTNGLYHNTNVHCQAIVQAQQAVENHSIPHKHVSISYNTTPIQLPELPLKHPCSLVTVTSTWQSFDQVRHEYSLCGVRYEKN